MNEVNYRYELMALKSVKDGIITRLKSNSKVEARTFAKKEQNHLLNPYSGYFIIDNKLNKIIHV